MAYDKVVDSASLDSKLTQVADAIRTKGNTSADLQFPSGFISAIQAIQTGTEMQIIVTVTSGATVTATKGNKVVSGTAANGTCTLTVPEEGEWTVSATLGGETSTSNIVNVTSSYDTTLVFASTTLNDNSWETIRAISDSGRGANFWSIGDRKAVTLNGTVGALTLSNFTTYAFIIGFNHNSSLEGANRIHFQLAKTAISGGKTIGLCDPGYNTQNYESGFIMNPGSSNSAGWRDSHMRNNICGTSLMSYAGTMIAVIPEELRAVIKSVTKYTDNASNGSTSSESNITATNDYFFLLGEFEVRGATDTNQYEERKQAQYAYYAAGNNPSAYRHDKTTEYAAWWLRSRDGGSFRTVINMNQASYVTYSSSYRATDLALVVGFCV